jgi:hypothetical protein
MCLDADLLVLLAQFKSKVSRLSDQSNSNIKDTCTKGDVAPNTYCNR